MQRLGATSRVKCGSYFRHASPARDEAGLLMTRAQRARVAAAAIAPATVAGLVLIQCGCAFAAFAIEIGVGLLYFIWILL